MDDSDLLKLLIRQSERLEDRIHEYVTSDERRFQAGLVVAAGAGPLWAIDPLAFLPVPFILMLVLYQSVQKDGETLALAAWQRSLEHRIHSISGEWILLWETAIADRGRTDPNRRVSESARLLAGAYGVFVLSLWGVGIATLWDSSTVTDELGSTWAKGLAVGYAMLGLATAVAVWANYQNRERLKHRTERWLNSQGLPVMPED